MGQGRRVAVALTRMGRVTWWLGVLCWLAMPAWGHQSGLTGYADIRLDGTHVRYVLTLSQIPPTLARFVTNTSAGPDLGRLVEALAGAVAISAGADRCPATGAKAEPPGQGRLSVTLTVDFRCPHEVRELSIRDDFFDLIGPDLHTLAKIAWPGGSGTFAFAAERRDARFAIAPSVTPATSVSSFFLLGIEHILTGYDHLLFLAALLVRAESWLAVLKVITAFTLAHSLTLALAVLGVVTPPDRWVEAAIALSIAYVAASNLFARRDSAGRWGASFLFGLVHGLGFSAVLREMTLPKAGLAWLLLQFNLGVETGQAIAAAVALAALAWLRTRTWRTTALRGISYAILAAGLVLMVDRAFF